MMNPVLFNGLDEMGDDDVHTFVTERSVKVYEHYMDYAIEDSSKIRQLCTLLRGVGTHDTVLIRVNSCGGRFDLAAQVINAINECAGTVVGTIEQECASAASMIFLSCHQWHLHPYSEMMIHNASYGAVGKGHEVGSKIRASETLMAKVIREVYADFLSLDEIEKVLEGVDIYLTSDEILSRLESLSEARNNHQEVSEDVEEEEAN